MMTNDASNPSPGHADSADIEYEYRGCLSYLYGRINYEKLAKPSPRHPLRLARMNALLSEMGNPQRACPIVHIAGTKGKGSTATMVARMAAASGLRVGLYTSPHLQWLEERFCVNGVAASMEQMIQLVQLVRSAAESVVRAGDGEPTFFELTTAIAFAHFQRTGCELAVLEVGLGGRLDSTNVCQPIVTAITSIGLDHQNILGHTLDKIAAEKAGIIKNNVPVISGVQHPEAIRVIARIAQQHDAPLAQIDRDFRVESVSPPAESADSWSSWLNVTPLHEHVLPLAAHRNLKLGLVGHHQLRNAAVALSIVDCLAFASGGSLALDERRCAEALAKLQISGRIECVANDPLVILDTAHNRDSIDALCDVLKQRFAARDTVVVFGTTADKDARQMLASLSQCVNRIVLTRYRTNPRWYPPQQLAQLAAEVAGQSWEVVEDAATAVEIARQRAGRDGVVVICGSFFLAAELRANLIDPN